MSIWLLVSYCFNRINQEMACLVACYGSIVVFNASSLLKSIDWIGSHVFVRDLFVMLLEESIHHVTEPQHYRRPRLFVYVRGGGYCYAHTVGSK